MLYKHINTPTSRLNLINSFLPMVCDNKVILSSTHTSTQAKQKKKQSTQSSIILQTVQTYIHRTTEGQDIPGVHRHSGENTRYTGRQLMTTSWSLHTPRTKSSDTAATEDHSVPTYTTNEAIGVDKLAY